jgi:hypothetical protein
MVPGQDSREGIYWKRSTLLFVVVFIAYYPQTLIKIRATQHDCLPSLLGDRDKWSEIVYSDVYLT